MANNFRIEITNEAQVLAAFKRAGIAPELVLEAAMKAGAEVIVEYAKAHGPGPHIDQETSKRSAKVVEVQAGPLDDHWYYRFLETGVQPHEVVPSEAKVLRIGDQFTRIVSHPGFAAEPFLRPAVDEQVDEITDEVGKPIKKAVESAGNG